MKNALLLLYILTCIHLKIFAKTKADIIIKNSKIYTVDEKFSTAEVMVIDAGKIVAIGSDTLLKSYTSDSSLDGNGKFIYPGFIDAHCHFVGQALDAYKLKLFGTTSFDEVIEKLLQYVKTSKHLWIEGTGWDQNDWAIKQFPNKDTLDKLFPDTPVFLLRVDGHAALVNQKAIELAGISEQTIIEGGEIEIRNHKLSGILIDNAINLVKEKIPELSRQDAIDYITHAQQKYIDVGLTGVVEPGITSQMLDYMMSVYSKGKLRLNYSFFMNADSKNLQHQVLLNGFRNHKLHMAGYKVYADGALGSRGAYLIDEYSDRPHHHGALLLSEDSLIQITKKVANTNLQLSVHAIGDAANKKVLEIYAEVLSKNNQRRWRIEHAQVVHSKDLHFFKDFNIIPSVQPSHASSDMYWVKERLGSKRMKDAYAYKSLLEQNAWLPLGTDFPVEDLNPLHTFYAAVFRKDSKGFPADGFQNSEALTREQALRGITIWAAKSVFEENEKGSLEVGKQANFVILDTDIMEANEKAIYDAKVLSTYIHGVKRN